MPADGGRDSGQACCAAFGRQRRPIPESASSVLASLAPHRQAKVADLLDELDHFDPEDDDQSDYGRGAAAGYARAIADLRAVADRFCDDAEASPTMLAVFSSVADFLEARRG